MLLLVLEQALLLLLLLRLLTRRLLLLLSVRACKAFRPCGASALSSVPMSAYMHALRRAHSVPLSGTEDSTEESALSAYVSLYACMRFMSK